MVDNENKVALLHVVNEKYYKLPGGGIDKNESLRAALMRECHEEIGSDIEIIDEIGSILEYRKIFTLKQISYCYFARLKGEKGMPHFTEEETAEGFEQVWLPYDEALAVLLTNTASNVEGSDYIVPRDTIILKEAESLVQSNR